MDNVTIKLQGGLGNYLFQIATAYSYGLLHDKNVLFNVSEAIQIHRHITTYQENIFRKVNFVSSINYTNFNLYREPNFSYDAIPFINGSVYLEGYFQSEKYFSEYEHKIKDLFYITEKLEEEIQNKYGEVLNQNTCSIHVRRGDYVNLSEHHPLCDIEYYKDAMEHMPNDTVYLVFSDDISWCKENFLGDNYIFIEDNSDIFDLYLMSLCNNNIIANSSYSWWGAWLNNNNNKIVVSPKMWFGPAKVGLNTKDVHCKNWIKI
jgi:hypothetical protein